MGSIRNYGPQPEPIAVVGLSCKFAGEASSPDRLWEMLAAGRSAWSEIPSSRFNLKGAYHPKFDRLSTVNVRGGHFLEQDLGAFDAQFFSFSAETASSMDPQIRLQLESVYEALENAGITLPEVAGTDTAVYAAMFGRDYYDGIIRDPDNLPHFMSSGTGNAMLSNRVSHFYDLRGPSLTLDTGCSGGLVALHQGIQALRSRETGMALICASNLFLNPDLFKTMGSLGMLSPDGKSYAFDSRANGFGRGEGIATVVIKRLSDAVAAGDAVRAIIRESGLNQDGKTETITTPREEAQVALMRDCYYRAGLKLGDTQYFEAHGTGTQTGDLIECRAIATVFKEYRGPEDPLRIGSVKTNIGHTESTSGLASLIKVILALEKGKIPPSINFEKPNSNLALGDWRLQVVTELKDWPVSPDGIRRASINNFGYGGTNAHLIVESPAAKHLLTPTNGNIDCDSPLDSQLLVFSARDQTSCQDMVSNLKLYLRNTAAKDSELLLRRVAYTLGQRRTLFPWVTARSVPVQKGLKEAIRALESSMPAPHRTTRIPRVGMVFSGQGAEWYAMGRGLITSYPVFESSLRETDEHVKALGATWSVIEELCRDIPESRVHTVELSIPLCVAVQISLVRLLRSWGVKPVAVTSHSSGEIAAAYAVGAINCKSAMAVAYHRALLAADKCLQLSNQGAMVAVGMGHREAKSYLAQLDTRSGMATVACLNRPANTTVSGDNSAVTELETHCLDIGSAFHSHHMKPIPNPYGMALHGLLSPAKDTDVDKIAFSSSVTGGRVHVSKLLEPEHWVENLFQPVQFVDAFTDMILANDDSTRSNVDVILEVGPHMALDSPIREILAGPEFARLNLPCLGCLVQGISAIESMHSLAASLLAEGLPLNLDAINFPRGRPSSIGLLSDLPAYPWNHQTRYWYESRFNKALRELSQPPHDLLGSLVLGTDLHNPSWRQILRLADAPWIRDHVVQNNILFPGAGFICLAIEALSQLLELQSENRQAVAGYQLRNIDILNALVIPENDDGVEIQTSLGQVKDRNTGTWEFKIFSVTPDNQWTIHARGLIMLEFKDALNKAVPRSRPTQLSGYKRHFEGCDLYAALRVLGINHKKKFQAITGIEQAENNNRADSLLSVPDTCLPTDLPYRLLVHPITLDAVIQTAYTPLLGKSEDTDAKVPRSIGSLWISSAISNKAGHQFKVAAVLQHADARSLRADITMVDYNDKDKTAMPVLDIRDAGYQSLGRTAAGLSIDDQWSKEPCIKLTWAPDISLLSDLAREHIRQHLSHPLDTNETRILLALRRVCLYYISDALAALSLTDISRLERHHAKFLVWMQLQNKRAADGCLGPDSQRWLDDTPEQRKRLIAEVRDSSVNGEMACQIGPYLPAILRKQKQPLELMLEDNLLNRYYRDALKIDRALPQAARILEYIVHKNPRARFLEIGGGTGGFTRYALPKIGTSNTGGPLAELYHFTDISSSFFEAAQKEFAPWSDIMLFGKLDIEVDPASQGFVLGSYDVVIAAQVLHATTSMTRTLSNVRKLMKPGGTLLLVETTQDQLDTEFSFGILPGWWLSEEPQRALSPSLSVSLWDETLRAAGFSGIDFNVRDCESDEWYMMSVITSTAMPPPRPFTQQSDSVVLVVRQLAPCEQLWLNCLRTSLVAAGHIPVVCELETAPIEAYMGKEVIFLGEVDQPLLYHLDAAGLSRIQTMIKHSHGLLWVTRGGAVDCERPELSLATGLLRSIRHEHAGAKYVTLDLDPNTEPWSCTAATAIMQVFTASFVPGSRNTAISPTNELEYAERKGVILVSRLFRDNDRNKALLPRVVDWSSSDAVSTEPIFQPERPLSLKVGIPGLLDTIVFDDDPAAPLESSRILPDLIEIKPRAYGVNFRDVLVAMGQLEERVMGVDCAGVITRVGSMAAAHGYAVGNHVFALLPEGGYSSRARAEWTNVMHMPSGLSFEQAASVPALFTTVYLCFYNVACLQRGQTVLIHAGAGGVGQTAIQFAQLIGAEVYTTVGSPEKQALIMERYGIPSDHIFSSRDASFAKGILEATDQRGVDVVLNSLSGPLLQASFNIIAPFGHFVEIGKRDIEQNSLLEMRPFSRHIKFSSFDLLALARHQGQLIHSALAEVKRLLEQGTISPVSPLSSYPLKDIAKAFRLLQTGKHTGKVILTIDPQEKVCVLPRARTPRFRSDASYILVGGAGGIGQSIARWLAAHGAHNLIVLSRSAAANPAAVELVAELKPRGCHVKLISCDASVESDLAAALETCARDLPPIRGVIQASMVLRDSVFEQMAFADWRAALDSKVKVSWNLHNQFRTADLDFFVLFSSMSGLYGYTTQSNYSAANSYVDALAFWRVSQGLPAVSLDLGPVKAVGFVAKSTGIAERMTRAGHYPVTEEQVVRALESAVLSPFDKHIALGINQGPGPHWDPRNASPLGRDARFRALQYREKTQRQATGVTGGASTSLASQLSGAKTRTEAEGFVIQAITEKLAEIFMIPVAHIDAASPLTKYGLDSLGAVELRNMLALRAAVDISIFDIMQSKSLAALASAVTRKSTHVPTSLMD
ncbi:hypothetical protein BDV11DRAFT_175032 [Aspergillus similis]